MKHGFVKVAAVTPKIKVADPEYNGEEIIRLISETTDNGAKIVVFPELCLSGYTCNDLFHQELLLASCKEQLIRIAESTCSIDAIVFVGLPLEKNGKLYNVAAALHRGEILAFIPKTCIPNYSEFYEVRYFTPGNQKAELVTWEEAEIPFGTKILFKNGDSLEGLILAAELCEDVWAPNPPSTAHALAGATVIVNLSASDEVVGKEIYRTALVTATSARLVSGYIYASAGEGESTQDIVFGGHNIIAENGVVLAQTGRFKPEIIYGDMDIRRIVSERRK